VIHWDNYQSCVSCTGLRDGRLLTSTRRERTSTGEIYMCTCSRTIWGRACMCIYIYILPSHTLPKRLHTEIPTN